MQIVPRPKIRALWLLLALLLVACGQPEPPTGRGSASSEVTPSLPPGSPTAQPTVWPEASPLPTEAPSETEALVQLDYEPTFYRPEASLPFGRVPPFTLLRDGRAIYLEEGREAWQEQLMAVQLKPEEREALLQQVLDLGFERLESYSEMCRDEGNGQSVCIADASFTILRVLLPSGELRDVRIYAEFANDLEAFNSIVELLRTYSHDRGEPYRPQQATLFIRATDEPGFIAPVDEPQPWPLDPGLLQPREPSLQEWALVLEGEQLQQLLETLPRNMGDYAFEYEGKNYYTYLVPWLPGVNYTEQVEAYGRPAEPPTQPPRITPTTASGTAPTATLAIEPQRGQEHSGITGRILLGPTCPVVIDDQPCPDQPYQATVVVENAVDGREVTRFTSDEAGRFSIELVPGRYRLVPLTPGEAMLPYANPQEVTVAPGEIVELTIQFDSGIR